MQKPCRHELIEKLIAILKETDPDEFDEKVRKAKQLLDTAAWSTNRNNLMKLFDNQITRLNERGVPETVVEFLANQRSSVVSKASKMTRKYEHVPFLPVIPLIYRSLYDLISMVRNGNKVGRTYMHPKIIADNIRVPGEPHYIYDIEDGESTRGMSPKEALKAFKSQKRSPLTIAEVMALATHTNVLSRHEVWVAGSQCISHKLCKNYLVPYMDMFNGEPRLIHNEACYSIPILGSPSRSY